MRFVHTSDWHAGRVWKGRDRLPELATVLEHLGDFLEKEKIELLLVTGDVFDSGVPSAEAERLVFRFFKRIGRAGTKTVVIAGNHDSPGRLDAWGVLAELVEVRTVARPCPPDRGGVIELNSRSGDKVIVAAIPFAPARYLVSASQLANDDTKATQRYADGMRQIVDVLTARFRGDAINLLIAHTHLDGARFSGSERTVHLGEEWAATPQALPATAHYIGLGHIHRPQRVDAAPAPTLYAGSPLQLDFGEAEEEKSFVVVAAAPRQPVTIERVTYQGGTALADVRGTLAELEENAPQLCARGWLRVTVVLSAPDPEINRKVRRLLPTAVSVDLELPDAQVAAQTVSTRGLSPIELFRAYSTAGNGREPEAKLLDAFSALHEAESETE